MKRTEEQILKQRLTRAVSEKIKAVKKYDERIAEVRAALEALDHK